MNTNDIVFSQVDENGPITHAIIGGLIFFSDDKAREMVRDAILIEREACAEVADAWFNGTVDPERRSLAATIEEAAEEIAAEIRARP